MPDVFEVTNQEELESRRLVWKSLLAGTRGANVCHSIDWVHLAFEHSYPQDWRILFVYSGRKPVGILPLTVTERITPLGKLRVLGYPSPLHAPSYSPVGPNPTATLTAGMQHIETQMDDWDVLELGPISPLVYDFQRTPTAMRLAGMDARIRNAHTLPTIDLRSKEDVNSGQHSLAELVRQSQDELESEFGTVHFQRFRPAGEVYDDLQLPTGALSEAEFESADDPDERAYMARVREMALRYGQLDFCRLQSNGRTLASTVGFHCAGRLTNLKCWVDASVDFERLSGALMLRLVCDSKARGDDELFLVDERLFDWANATSSVQTYSFVRKSSFRARAASWLPQSWSAI